MNKGITEVTMFRTSDGRLHQDINQAATVQRHLDLCVNLTRANKEPDAVKALAIFIRTMASDVYVNKYKCSRTVKFYGTDQSVDTITSAMDFLADRALYEDIDYTIKYGRSSVIFKFPIGDS